jgi:hypothetical protein
MNWANTMKDTGWCLRKKSYLRIILSIIPNNYSYNLLDNQCLNKYRLYIILNNIFILLIFLFYD